MVVAWTLPFEVQAGRRQLVITSPPAAIVARVEGWWVFIDTSATRYGVRQSLIEAVIHQESGGDPDAFRVEAAVNDASFGLMQVLLGTAHTLGYRGTPRGMFLPAVNIDLGAHYLADLGHQLTVQHLVLLNYNGGPKAVELYRQVQRGFPADRYADNVDALQVFYQDRNRSRGLERP